MQYSLPFWRVTPWIKFDVRNVFNRDTQINGVTSIVADNTSPKDAFGYPTGFKLASSFGRPRAATDYVSPRQYLLYAGVRF